MALVGISEAAVASLKFKQLHFPTGCHLPNSLWVGGWVGVCGGGGACVFAYCMFVFVEKKQHIPEAPRSCR